MSLGHAKRCSRQNRSEMPDWLKKKHGPHRHKYLSGNRVNMIDGSKPVLE